MGRKEEIKKGAFDAFPNEGWERQRVAFVQGALWADEHPSKELKEKMMHDICGWLDWHAKDYIGATYGPAPQYESYHLIYDLKEYMEDLENGKA